jgi:hypothetical protein
MEGLEASWKTARTTSPRATLPALKAPRGRTLRALPLNWHCCYQDGLLLRHDGAAMLLELRLFASHKRAEAEAKHERHDHAQDNENDRQVRAERSMRTVIPS